MPKQVLRLFAALFLSPFTTAHAGDTFTTTGNLASARYHHAATLLPNGKILATGGRTTEKRILNGQVIRATTLATSEVFDPATGKWTATGPMNTARAQHTATLLSNGKVIVVGGTSVQGPPPSIPELYNPATGTWIQTPAPLGSNGGTSFRTVLLASGNLLSIWVTGTPSAAKAAIYDVANNTWTVTGAMNTTVPFPTLTLLPNGKVLAAGGFGANNTASGNAELYDPATGTWTATGAMKTGRFYHAAVLLPNGKVLAAGGNVTTSTSPLADSELYDPITGEWTVAAPLPGGHSFSEAIPLTNGKILLGYLYDDFYQLLLYNPVIGDFSYTQAEFRKTRYNYSKTLLPDGRVLFAAGIVSKESGYEGTESTLSEIYDPLHSRAEFNAWIGSINASKLTQGQRVAIKYTASAKLVLVGDLIERQLILYNSGTENLELGPIQVDGPSASDFTAAGPDVSSLPPGKTTIINITFKPTKARYPSSHTATFHLTSNDLENSTFNITFDGWVRSRGAEIGVLEVFSDWRKDPRYLKDSASAIRFGKVKLGRSVTKTFFISNQGGSPLNDLSIKRDGKNANDFSISAIKNTTLNTDDVATIKVTFKPKAKGIKSAAIHISSNDADENPFDIKLSGAGSDP